jgi:2-oxoglutarate dehydrogenase E2 component (dihydrolipoamide succinyltransferase)
MMTEIKLPSPGESVTEVQISKWLKKDGDYVEKDEELAEIDSDKATLSLIAEASGVLKILVKEGDTVSVGTVACTIDTEAAAPAAKPEKAKQQQDPAPAQPAEKSSPKQNENAPAANEKKPAAKESYASGTPSVAAEKIMREQSVGTADVKPTGKDGRITKADVMESIRQKETAPKATPAPSANGSRNERREKMTMLRKKIAQRLVAVKNETAMLTTFNEVDMTNIMNIRKQFKNNFAEKHGVSLGFMSFFTKAVTEALKSFPAVNARIEGDEIIYHDYADIGIAVSAPKGLMVPIIRNAEMLSMAQIESVILDLAGKARESKLSMEEMTGGTFTITNGGVFGSMMSTPIINPPQSAILGMHNIVERPMAVNGKVEIRPMMYVAVSYDHRIIDGKESVGFLVKVKQMLEEPVKMLFAGNDPIRQLLGM